MQSCFTVRFSNANNIAAVTTNKNTNIAAIIGSIYFLNRKACFTLF